MPRRLARIAETRAVRLACLGLALVMTVNLFHLGAGPGAVNLLTPPWDKVAHFTTFAGLTLLLAIGAGLRRPWLVLAAVLLIGLGDELHQSTLPGREAGVDDWITDAAGALFALTLIAIATRRRA